MPAAVTAGLTADVAVIGELDRDRLPAVAAELPGEPPVQRRAQGQRRRIELAPTAAAGGDDPLHQEIDDVGIVRQWGGDCHNRRRAAVGWRGPRAAHTSRSYSAIAAAGRGGRRPSRPISEDLRHANRGQKTCPDGAGSQGVRPAPRAQNRADQALPALVGVQVANSAAALLRPRPADRSGKAAVDIVLVKRKPFRQGKRDAGRRKIVQGRHPLWEGTDERQCRRMRDYLAVRSIAAVKNAGWRLAERPRLAFERPPKRRRQPNRML